MSGAWSQLEQLLSCAICMDRFKNPKLLPCQHTYCCDPCMEGLVDYARRQIKCPECRAEHRIPYNGVQTLPTNVTLMRFLELHRSITGEEPEPEEAMMARCAVCSEKQYVQSCYHCHKKICSDCKDAHLDVMRREISRIAANVRRSVARLEDTLKESKKNEDKLTMNCVNIREEIVDIIGRNVRDLEKLKERLTSELDCYEESEKGTLSNLTEDLEQELTTISANCDVAEKYIDEDHEWTDAELVEYKEIFAKSLEFVRNFDADTTDYSRRVRLNVLTDTEQIHKMLIALLELKIQPSSSVNQSICAPQGQLLPNALMRSQSDHRLASQFKKGQIDSRSMLDISQQLSDNEREERGREGKSDILRRYGLLGDEDGHSGRTGYKSKYVRDLLQEQDSLMRPTQTSGVRFEEQEKAKEPEIVPKVFDTDGAVRAPLSGIVKIEDSGKFMERVFESEKKAKAKKEEKENLAKMQQQQQQLTQMAQQRMQQQMAQMRAQQQASQQQQAAIESTTTETGSGTTGSSTGSSRPAPAERQVSDEAEKEREREKKAAAASSTTGAGNTSSYDDPASTPRHTSTTSRTAAAIDTEDRGSDTGSLRTRRSYLDDNTRTSSRDSTSSSRPVTRTISSDKAEEAAPYSRTSSLGDYPSRTSSGGVATRRLSYGSRQSSRVQESDSDSESEESEPVQAPPRRNYDESSAVSALLSRSQEARKGVEQARKGVEQEREKRNRSSSFQRSRSSHLLGSGTANNSEDDVSDSEQEKALNSRRSFTRGSDSPAVGYGFPRSAYVQKRDCKLSVGKRGSEPGSFTWPRSVAVGPDGSMVVADSSNHRIQVLDSNGRFVRYFGKQGSGDGELDNPAGIAVNRIGQIIVSDRYNNRVQIFDATGRFIRAFGGDGRSDGKFQCPWGLTTDSLGFIYVCDKENHRIQVFQSDGTFVGKMGSVGSRPGCLEQPSYIAVSNTNRVIVSDTNNHRIQVFDVNGRCMFTFGGEGSEDGLFRFPRGVAVDDQGFIIVSDSGNNRIQIFQADGTFIKSFGSWGSEAGKFKGLEDIAVSSKGDIVACDRENHRIQVF